MHDLVRPLTFEF